MRAGASQIVGTFDALNNLLPRDVEAFERQGVPADALAGPGPVRASHVIFDDATFQFEHHGQREGVRAFLFIITDPHGVAQDVVAWAPDRGKFCTWLGRAWALGEDCVFAPRLSEHAGLPMWRNPFGWLRVRRKGLCLVRPNVAIHHLTDAGPLLAEDAAHGAELQHLLTRPSPRILIPAPIRSAA